MPRAPRTLQTGPLQPTSVRLSHDLKETLQAKAAEQRWSLTFLIEIILQEWLKKNRRKK